MTTDNAPSARRTLILRTVAGIAIAAVLAGSGYLIWQQVQIYQAQQRMQGAEVPETPAEQDAEEERELPENPIDFNALWENNVESYAWLYIPGAQINTPIQQSATDDFFYLAHDQNGDYSPVGTAFSQVANSLDFSDPVTVIYGHDIDGVFKNLHYFEDQAFFDENPTFYIYRPGHIYTYTVVSAYKYDDRHILNSFDFSKEDVRQSYFDFVAHPDSLLKCVREGVELTTDSKIVQLSTCMLNEFHGTSRYLVSAVLTSDQETK